MSTRRVTLSALLLPGLIACFPAQAQVTDGIYTGTIGGLTGLVRVPTARLLPDGAVRLSWTPPDERRSHPGIGARSAYAVTLGLVPRTEIGLSLGLSSASYDLAAQFKVLVVPPRGSGPAVAAGLLDASGNGPQMPRSPYMVATWPLAGGRADATFGAVGGDRNGLLAGLAWHVVPRLILMAEYDSQDLNLGAACPITDRLWARTALLRTGMTATLGYAAPIGTQPAGAQTPATGVSPGPAAAATELVGLGLEDVQVRTEVAANGGRRLIASCENRVWTRNQQDAVRAILAVLARHVPDGTGVVGVRIMRRGVEVAEAVLPVEGGPIQPTVHLLHSRGLSVIETSTPVLNRSAWHLDATVGPSLLSAVGTNDGALQVGVLGLVEAGTTIAQGFAIDGMASFPVGGGLLSDRAKRWTGERALMHWMGQPLPGWLVQASAGRFPGQNDGAVLEVARLVGQCGLASVTTGPIHGDRLGDRLYGLVEYRHWLPGPAIQLRAVGGRFVTGDRGGGIDLLRFYGDVEVGIQFRSTSSCNTGGVHLSVPLGPCKQARPTRLRARIQDRFTHTLSSVILGDANFLALLDRTAGELSIGANLWSYALDRGRLLAGSGSWDRR